MSYPSPILRIEVEGVKHAIAQHLGAGAQEFAQIVEDELAKLDIEEMIRGELRRQAHMVVVEAVREASSRISRSIAERLIEELRDEIEKIHRDHDGDPSATGYAAGYTQGWNAGYAAAGGVPT